MVNPDEGIDLDPAMEDILSVWGKDPTTQNVERYFGTVEALASPPFCPEPERSPHTLSNTAKELQGMAAVQQGGSFSISFKDRARKTLRQARSNHILGAKGN